MLLIEFDSPTNYGLGVIPSPYSEFPCNQLLVFVVGAEYATCKWSSSRVLVAVIDGSRSTLTAGDTITLLSAVVRPGGLSAAAAITVVISPPANPSPPVVALSTAKTIGACDDIILDPTSSSGSGGRPWSKIKWIVTGSGATAAGAVAVSDLLNTRYNITTTSVIEVPKRSPPQEILLSTPQKT